MWRLVLGLAIATKHMKSVWLLINESSRCIPDRHITAMNSGQCRDFREEIGSEISDPQPNLRWGSRERSTFLAKLLQLFVFSFISLIIFGAPYLLSFYASALSVQDE